MLENLKTESDPAKTKRDDAANLKSCRIWVVSWEWLESAKMLFVGEDDDVSEEAGVEEEKEGGHPHLQVYGLLSSTMAPKRDGCELAH